MPKKKLISETAARIKIHKTRFTPAEDAQIRKLAAAAGRPVAVVIREAALGVPIQTRRTAATDEMVRRLAHAGAQLRAVRDSAAVDQRSEDRARAQAALAVIEALILEC